MGKHFFPNPPEGRQYTGSEALAYLPRRGEVVRHDAELGPRVPYRIRCKDGQLRLWVDGALQNDSTALSIAMALWDDLMGYAQLDDGSLVVSVPRAERQRRMLFPGKSREDIRRSKIRQFEKHIADYQQRLNWLQAA